MRIDLKTVENGWLITRVTYENKPVEQYVATNDTLMDLLQKLTGVEASAYKVYFAAPADEGAEPKDKQVRPVFSPGDEVECIDAMGSGDLLQVGSVYKVIKVDPQNVVVVSGFLQTWAASRFRKVEPAPAPKTDEKVSKQYDGRGEITYNDLRNVYLNASMTANTRWDAVLLVLSRLGITVKE